MGERRAVEVGGVVVHEILGRSARVVLSDELLDGVPLVCGHVLAHLAEHRIHHFRDLGRLAEHGGLLPGWAGSRAHGSAVKRGMSRPNGELAGHRARALPGIGDAAYTPRQVSP